jgi:hypothetical protein
VLHHPIYTKNISVKDGRSIASLTNCGLVNMFQTFNRCAQRRTPKGVKPFVTSQTKCNNR